MNKQEIEKAIERLEALSRYAQILKDPSEYFHHMNGHTTELSLVLASFDIAELSKEIQEILTQQLNMQEQIDKAHDAGYYAGMQYVKMQDKQQLNNGTTEPICKINNTDCTGYDNGKCHSIENCRNKVEQPVITTGDKIRESNESLAETIQKSGIINCFHCPAETKECAINGGCSDAWIAYLNQPYIPTQ